MLSIEGQWDTDVTCFTVDNDGIHRNVSSSCSLSFGKNEESGPSAGPALLTRFPMKQFFVVVVVFLPLVRHQVDEAPVSLLRLEKEKNLGNYRVRGARTQHLLRNYTQAGSGKHDFPQLKKK